MRNNNILRSSTPGVPDSLPDGTTKAQAEALGWSENPTTPADNEHTWMTQVFIVDDDYTNCHWSDPVRISGDIGPQGIRGSDGSDGTDFEFIYTRNNGAVGPQGIRGPQAPEAPVYDSNDNPVNTQPDWKGTDSNGVLWTDNPQGVQADLQFEYMVQRKKLSGHQAWEPYEPQTAVVWSKWGENGRDGDGYEYIYRTSSNLITNWGTQGQNNPQNWNSTSATDRNGHDWDDDEYLGPNGSSTWTDNPVSVDSTTNRYQYVSTRKKSGNPAEWHSFSQPALWSQYADPGSVGPEGPQGPAGPAGPGAEYYALMPLQEIFDVRINAESVGAQAYENITGSIYTYLIYGVAHVENDSITYLTSTQLRNNYELQIIANPYTSSLDCTKQFSQTGYGTGKLNANTASETTIGTIYFLQSNLLAAMWPNDTDYQDYYKLHQSGITGINRAPQKINIALVRKSDSQQMDHRSKSLTFKPSHLFSVADTALNSIYQGISGTNGKYTTTGFSNIRQTWDQIKLGVNNLKYENEGKLEQDTDIEEYIYQRNNSSTGPSALPQATTWDTTPSNWYAWNNYPAPTESQQYVWQSHRTRTQTINSNGSISYGDPTAWSIPILYEKYGVPRSSVNTAQLTIAADEIRSTVTQQYSNAIKDAVMNGKTIEIDLTYSALESAGISFSSIGGTKASADSTNNYKAEAVFIPVGISFDSAAGKRGEGWDIVIERSFDRSMGYPYYSTHGGGNPVSDANVYSSGDGFEFAVAWHTVGSGYGTSWYAQGTVDSDGFYSNEKNITDPDDTDFGKDTYRYILQNESNWTRARTYTYNNTSYSIPQNLVCGSIRQDGFATIELIYLRGGSKYRIHTDNFDATATVYKTGYDKTINGHRRNMPVIYPNNISKIISPKIDKMKRSEIVQTADEISLSVYEGTKDDLLRTGIDITNGQITLDAANTNIVGNLNLRRADNGLTVYDSDGNPKINIHPSSIASKNDSATTEVSGYLNACHLYNNPTSFDFTTDTSYSASKLGYYESGAKINITGIYFNANAAPNGSTYEQTWRGTINYEIKLYKSSVSPSNLVKTITGTTTGSTITNISNQSYTTGTTATYYVTVRFYGSLSNVSSFICQPTYFMTVDRGLVTEIGTNGLTIKQGTNKFAYFDENVSELRYNNSGIRLDSTTGSNTIVKQYIGSYTDTSIPEANREIYKSIGLTKKIQTVSSGTWSFMTHPDIDMVICTGAGCTIQLPGYYSPDANYSYNRHVKIPVGTTLYIKGYNNTTVTAPNGSIVRNESNYTDNQTSVGIGSRVHMYICAESTETTAKWIDCLF